MINIAALLDKAKDIHSLKSDYKLALVMGISQTALIHYRAGKSLPDARVISKICELTGDDAALLAAEIEAQRAKTDEARALWTSIARRLSLGVAAGISAAALSGCFWVSAAAFPTDLLHRVCILCKVQAVAAARRFRQRCRIVSGFFVDVQNEKAFQPCA
jgi:transcriptional regulator with XRE-family HTH domain